GLFAAPGTINAQLGFLASVMPASAYQLISDQVVRIAAHGGGGLTLAFLAGLAIALWSANAGVKAIFDALNIVYDEDEKRSFVMLNLVSLAFTLVGIAVFIVILGAVVVVPLVLTFLGFAAREQAWLLLVLRWPVLF